jgi:hypothetical protein
MDALQATDEVLLGQRLFVGYLYYMDTFSPKGHKAIASLVIKCRKRLSALRFTPDLVQFAAKPDDANPHRAFYENSKK